MGSSDEQPTAGRSGEHGQDANIGEDEAREKGPWAAKAAEGIVPDELGGSDAPGEPQGDDADLDSAVLGTTTGSDVPATSDGVDLSGGDNADATTDGGPTETEAPEPDLRDAGAGPRQSDVSSAE